jgi:hypothetical protein
VPADDGLHVIDLSSPARITDSGPLPMPTDGATAAAIADDLLAITTDRDKLITVDVRQRTSPVARAAVDVTLCDDCAGFDVVGDTLFIASAKNGLRTARLPALAVLGGASADRTSNYENVVVANGIAYVGDHGFGLRAYDVSDPTLPRALGQLSLHDGSFGDFVGAMAYEDGRVYVGWGAELIIVDVSKPSQPVRMSTTPIDQEIVRLRVRDRRVYVAGSPYHRLTDGAGLIILDAATPDAVQVLGHFDCAGSSDLTLSGNLVALACAGAFVFVDVADPTRPIQRSAWMPPVRPPMAVASDGTRVYLGHGGGVTAFDLADPSTPKQLAEHATAAAVQAVRTTAGHVLATCGQTGVYRWDAP